MLPAVPLKITLEPASQIKVPVFAIERFPFMIRVAFAFTTTLAPVSISKLFTVCVSETIRICGETMEASLVLSGNVAQSHSPTVDQEAETLPKSETLSFVTQFKLKEY